KMKYGKRLCLPRFFVFFVCFVVTFLVCTAYPGQSRDDACSAKPRRPTWCGTCLPAPTAPEEVIVLVRAGRVTGRATASRPRCGPADRHRRTRAGARRD